jgi:O-antigen/teichoic acid export membrane protein
MGIRKNMVSNMLLTTSAVIFPLITFPYVTRTLSSNSIGKYFFVDALTQYFIVFAAVGIPFYGIREIAKVKNDNRGRSKLVVELLTIQITLSLLVSAVYVVIHYFIPALENESRLVQIACLGIISTSFLMEWFYQGIENFTYITGRSLIIKSLSVASILLLVKNADDYLIYYLLTTLVILFNAGLNFVNYLKNYHSSFEGSLDIKKHIKPLLILFSINISVSIYAMLDTIILGLLTNTENVSFYNVPLKLAKIYWTVVNGAGMVLIPRIASYFVDQDMAGIQLIMQKSISVVFLLAIPFCFFCMVFPTEILQVISGSKYLHAANALRVLSIVPLIIAVCNVCGTQFLMPIGQEKSILYGTLIGLTVSLLLNFCLIPYLKFMGAAIACVAAEATVCIYIVISAAKRTRLLIDYSLLSQILLSLAIAFAARLLLVNYMHGLILVMGTVAVYCIVFVVLQVTYFKNRFVFSLVPLKSSKS